MVEGKNEFLKRLWQNLKNGILSASLVVYDKFLEVLIGKDSQLTLRSYYCNKITVGLKKQLSRRCCFFLL